MNDTLKNIFQTLSENAEENFIKNKNAEDYLAEDGLWHCGKCGTCVERKEALAAAGIEDTTEYEA